MFLEWRPATDLPLPPFYVVWVRLPCLTPCTCSLAMADCDWRTHACGCGPPGLAWVVLQVFKAIRLPALDSDAARQAFRRSLKAQLTQMRSPLVFFPEVGAPLPHTASAAHLWLGLRVCIRGHVGTPVFATVAPSWAPHPYTRGGTARAWACYAFTSTCSPWASPCCRSPSGPKSASCPWCNLVRTCPVPAPSPFSGTPFVSPRGVPQAHHVASPAACAARTRACTHAHVCAARMRVCLWWAGMLGSSVLRELLWLFFVPATQYTLEFLPEVARGLEADPQPAGQVPEAEVEVEAAAAAAAARTAAAIGAALGIPCTHYTKHDALALRRRLAQDPALRLQLLAGTYREG